MRVRSPGPLGLVGVGLLLAGWLLGSTLAPPVARTQGRGDGRAPAPADLPASVIPFTAASPVAAVEAPRPARNPFTFGGDGGHAPGVSSPSTPASAPDAEPSADVPSGDMMPMWALAGVASDAGVFTAIITGDGKVHLVQAGDQLPGGIDVVAVNEADVHLRDAQGVVVLRLR